MTYEGGNDNVTTMGNRQKLNGNGDFRSDESIGLLKQSDIIITNPPFSLFRDLIKILIDTKKDFIIVGNINAVTYVNIFPHIKNGNINIGYNTESKKYIRPDGSKKTIPSYWYTNYEVNDKNRHLNLTVDYNKENYTKYDNYDAINIDKLKDIPRDYYNIMGVPVSFMKFYDTRQFEIVGMTSDKEPLKNKTYNREQLKKWGSLNSHPVIIDEDGNFKSLFKRILIKRVK